MMGDAEAGWGTLAQALIGGIAHDLAGRATALMGVVHVARTTGGMSSDLVGILDEQVARLQQSIRLLRALPIGPAGSPQLLRVCDVISEAARIYACRSGPQPPRVTLSGDDAAIVYLPLGPLTEALLLIMAAAEQRSAWRAGELAICWGVDDAECFVRVRRAASWTLAQGDHDETDAPSMRREARAAAQRLGGQLTAIGGADAQGEFELRLPAVRA